MASDEKDDRPAAEQFPIVDPERLRKGLRVFKLRRPGSDWRPGSTAATVTLELTAQQAQFLAMRGKRRFGLTDDAEAIKREIDHLIELDGRVSSLELWTSLEPWARLVQNAKLKRQRGRLRDFVRRGLNGEFDA